MGSSSSHGQWKDMISAANLPYTITSGLFVLVNLIGNSLVCMVIILNKSMRTPLNYLLLNLAFADIMVGILTLPVQVFGSFYTHPRGKTGEWFCKFISSDILKYTCGQASTFTLAAVAYERYQAVVHPLLVKERITKKKTVVFIALAWIISAFFEMFWIVWVGLDGESNQCRIKPKYKDSQAIFNVFQLSLVFGFPFLMMLILYGRVVWQLTRKQVHSFDRKELAANRAKKRVTLMLVSVTAVFAASWGVGTIVVFRNKYVYGSGAARVLDLLVAFNSSVNGFLYALFSDQFRKGFKGIFLGCNGVRRRTVVTYNREKVSPMLVNGRKLIKPAKGTSLKQNSRS